MRPIGRQAALVGRQLVQEPNARQHAGDVASIAYCDFYHAVVSSVAPTPPVFTGLAWLARNRASRSRRYERTSATHCAASVRAPMLCGGVPLYLRVELDQAVALR